MKKLIYLFSVSLVLAGTFGCKKGDDDPFLSLRSRKARLTGEWKVTNQSQVSTNSDGLTSSTTTVNYNGTTMTTDYVSTPGGFELHTTEIASMDMTFEKDGTYKMVYTTTDSDGSMHTETTEGNWAFIGASKSADLKNKEAITLSVTKMSNSDGEYESFDGTMINYDNMIISQLKNKEIVFTIDESGSDNNSNWTRKGSVTLTKK